jgi:histidyl-tRNA synthetase
MPKKAMKKPAKSAKGGSAYGGKIAPKPALKAEAPKLPLAEPVVKKTSEPQVLRGFKDILPAEYRMWQHLEDKARASAMAHGFDRIETPILEPTALFIRTVGKQTDIVEKEMYTFIDKGEESVSLRPEATAAIARAYVNHGMLNMPQPVKLWYWGPMFRYERPQSGRFREHHQFGFETLGEAHPIVDAELIAIGTNVLRELGLEVVVQVNSIGTKESRVAYVTELVNYYRSRRSEICEDDKRRLTRNPLRVLDCKVPTCQPVKQGAPQIVDFLDEDSKNHFMRVLEYLDDAGVTYQLNPQLVRGLDYYSRTVWEFYTSGDDEGAMSAVGGGGRYDSLVEMVGGRPTPAAGFAIGVERVINRLRAKGLDKDINMHPDVFVAQLGEAARKKTLLLVDELRKAGIAATSNLAKDGLKQQLEIANRIAARFTVILGQKEVLDGTIIVRDMDNGIQEIVDFKKVASELKRKLAAPALPRVVVPLPPINREDISIPPEEEEEIEIKLEAESGEPKEEDKEEKEDKKESEP